MKAFVPAAVAIALSTSAAAEEEIRWTTSTSGGGTIEIPVFMTEGWVRALLTDGEDYGTAFEPDLYPVQLRQYRTESREEPYAYLLAAFGTSAAEITYRFDRPPIAAISGYTEPRQEIFYAMCRGGPTVICFDIHYPPEAQPMFGPIVERIARSFQGR